MNYRNKGDNELWASCRKDDQIAYNELFRRYSPRILRLVSSYVKDRMVAEELFMDLMFNLWAKRKQLTIQGDFSNYLFASVRNTVISYLRKEIPVTIRLEEVGDEYPSGYSTDARLLSEEAEQIYISALKKLSPRRRQIYMLSRYEKLSYSLIAKKMNLSNNTVRNYMAAALDGLRANMKEYLPTLLLSLLLLHSLLFLS